MEKIKLYDLCDVRDGTHDSPQYVAEGYPLVTSKNIINGQIDITNVSYISKEDYEAINRRSNVDNGDILMPMIGTIGGPVVVNKEFEFAIKNVALIKFYEDSKVMPTYIRYILDSNLFKQYVEKENRGGTQKFISLGNIRSFLIPLVSLDKQQEITTILNKLSQIIKNRKEQIGLLDDLVKSRFVEMFDTLNNNNNGFDIVSIEDVCSLIKDGTHQTPEYTEDAVNGFQFLSSKDVMTQKIDWTGIKYIPAELHDKLYATIKPQRNDILMSKNGVNYGVAAVNDTDEVFDIYVSLALLRPTEVINPVYFRCVINNPDTKRQFDGSIKGIGVPNLHLGEIKKTRILLPPLECQNRFVQFVHQVDKLKADVQKSLDETQILFDSLMQKYFG